MLAERLCGISLLLLAGSFSLWAQDCPTFEELLSRSNVSSRFLKSLDINFPSKHSLGFQATVIDSPTLGWLDPWLGRSLHMVTYRGSADSKVDLLAFYKKIERDFSSHIVFIRLYPWPHSSAKRFDDLLMLYLKAQHPYSKLLEYGPAHPIHLLQTRRDSPIHSHASQLLLLPWVYPFVSEYTHQLLTQALDKIADRDDVLVIGTGSGIEAVTIASLKQAHVDATDISPVAVANTEINAHLTQTDARVRAWVSDGLDKVTRRYDVIVFNAPLAVEWLSEDRLVHEFNNDVRLFDPQGALLRKVFSVLPNHLNTGGRLYLMSHMDVDEYLPYGLHMKRLTTFTVSKTKLAIYEIQVKNP